MTERKRHRYNAFAITFGDRRDNSGAIPDPPWASPADLFAPCRGWRLASRPPRGLLGFLLCFSGLE
jgi:hypothetical protein